MVKLKINKPHVHERPAAVKCQFKQEHMQVMFYMFVTMA